MAEEMSQGSVGDLFMCVLQHMKCIEVRLDFAKSLTSKKQKYALSNAAQKVRVAIDHVCGLLGDSTMVARVKNALKEEEMLNVMLLTEQLSRMPDNEDIEHVIEYIENYLNAKYGPADQTEQVPGNGQDPVLYQGACEGSHHVL